MATESTVMDEKTNPKDVCANCSAKFDSIPYNGVVKSYKRFSFYRKMPDSDVTAREVLERIIPVTFPSSGTVRSGQNFLCTLCWAELQKVHKYHIAVDNLLARTTKTGYIGRKRAICDHDYSIKDAKVARMIGDDPQSATDSEACNTSKVAKQANSSNPMGFGEIPAPDTTIRYNIITLKAADLGFVAEDPKSSNCPDPSPLFKVDENLVNGNQRQRLVSSSTKALHIDKIKASLTGRHYIRALRQYCSFSKGAMRAFHRIAADIVRKEVRKIMAKKKSVLCKDATLSDISSFSWDELLNEVELLAPLLFTVLKAVATKRKNGDVLARGTRNLKPLIGNAISVLMYAHAAGRANFLQKVNSINLWRSGMKKEPLEQLGRLGICLGCSGTDKVVSDIQTDFDSAALKILNLHKNALATQVIDDSTREANSEEANTSDSSQTESLSDISNSKTKTLQPGYTFCWGSASKKVARQCSLESQTPSTNITMAYIALNRVPSTHLSSKLNDLKDATSMPLDTFIPSDQDEAALRRRMQVIVQRIITRHIPYFQVHFSDCTVAHIKHKHFKESTQKSLIVKLGIFRQNPSTTQDAINVYDELMQYVPDYKEMPYPTLVFGDARSCKLGQEGKIARANEPNGRQSLQALEPAAQESHKETQLLKDFYDVFYDEASMEECGTLSHACKKLQAKQVKPNATESFYNSWDLMSSVTEAHVCTIAAQLLLGMPTLHSKPANAPKGIEERDLTKRTAYLRGIAEDIVAAVWHPTNTTPLHQHAKTQNIEVYCCNENKVDALVECSMKKNCKRGQYFHLSCTKWEEVQKREKWFCSSYCAAKYRNCKHKYPFCVCGVERASSIPMIWCSAGFQCLRKEWYHYKCISMSEKKVPKDSWYCSPECAAKVKSRRRVAAPPEPDHVCHYIKSLTWRGLNLLCRRDAVCEADGTAMMSHWRFDLLHFFSTQHMENLIQAHRLVASVSGWLSPKLVQDLVWNRTVNYSGGEGRNLPVDLADETLKRGFSDLLNNAGGQSANKPFKRSRRLVVPVAEALDKIYSRCEKRADGTEVDCTQGGKGERDAKVADMIDMYLPANLTSTIPGRHYRAFPNFSYCENPKSPEEYSKKITKLSQCLDKLRKQAPDN